jgi:superfamily II DNA or RNA helicase
MGSSNNPIRRRNDLQTALPLLLELKTAYLIKNYSAYTIDAFLRKINNYQDKLKIFCLNIQHYEPINKGGDEHYLMANIEDLKKLFTILGIEYEEVLDFSIFGDDVHEEIEPDLKIVEKLEHQLSTLNIKTAYDRLYLKLRPMQKDCVNAFKNNLHEYFQAIFSLATGLGKTWILVCCCLWHLHLYPNENILWITFKNEIVDSQRDDILNYLGGLAVICNHAKFNEKNIKKMKNDESGKVFIVLRQSLMTDKLPQDSIGGFFNDECHDAIAKGERTFDFILNLTTNQPNLRYRIGLSATPYTDENFLNANILYGKGIEKNILYECNYKTGFELQNLLEPQFKLCSFNNYDDFIKLTQIGPNEVNDTNTNLENTILDKIKNIYTNIPDQKGIIWTINNKSVEYLYQKLKVVFKDTNIKVYMSTEKCIEYDKTFTNAKDNCVMIACQKFTTGYNSVNLGCGILLNFSKTHLITQKFGRFSRINKTNHVYAYLYMFCDMKHINKYNNALQRVCTDYLGFNAKDNSKYVTHEYIKMDLYKENMLIDNTNDIYDDLIEFDKEMDKIMESYYGRKNKEFENSTLFPNTNLNLTITR